MARAVTPSRAARLASGLTLAVICKRAHCSPRYLQDCERRQWFTHVLARRLARLYGCDLDEFLPQPIAEAGSGLSGGESAGSAAGRGRRARRGERCTTRAQAA